jgi:hypothetical protein
MAIAQLKKKKATVICKETLRKATHAFPRTHEPQDKRGYIDTLTLIPT